MRDLFEKDKKTTDPR